MLWNRCSTIEKRPPMIGSSRPSDPCLLLVAWSLQLSGRVAAIAALLNAGAYRVEYSLTLAVRCLTHCRHRSIGHSTMNVSSHCSNGLVCRFRMRYLSSARSLSALITCACFPKLILAAWTTRWSSPITSTSRIEPVLVSHSFPMSWSLVLGVVVFIPILRVVRVGRRSP